VRKSAPGGSVELFYLNRLKEGQQFVDGFKAADHVILAFPLYTDAMPAIVKVFIESLEPLCGRQGNPGIGFIVQNGFPEVIHSRFVEKYLEKLAARLGCHYHGTVIKGGVEGYQERPAFINRKLFRDFHRLGVYFAGHTAFDPEIVHKFTRRERMSKSGLRLFKLFDKAGFIKHYWFHQLIHNKAFKYRFARPYVE